MEITQRVEGDITVFLPDGRIDTLAADELDQALLAAVVGGSHKIVVDMSKVDYISSAGLRSLAAVLVRCRVYVVKTSGTKGEPLKRATWTLTGSGSSQICQPPFG